MSELQKMIENVPPLPPSPLEKMLHPGGQRDKKIKSLIAKKIENSPSRPSSSILKISRPGKGSKNE